MNLNKEVANQLRTAADDIENNRCGLNQNEIQDLASVVMHIEMNKSEAANYLGLSVRTFDRYIANGWFGNGNGDFSNMVNNDSGRALLMQAIQGNGNAIGQLATTLNCDSDSIRSAINGVMTSVQQVGNQVGLTSTQVINSIQAGNANLGQQLASCCCNVREAITNQGYENRIATLEQTNALSSKIDAGDAAIAQAIQAQTTVINDKFCDLEKRELQNRITELIETRNTLQGQISNANQTAAIQSYVASVINPIAQEVTSIKQSLPSTVSVQYPQLTVIPNYYMNQASIWG